MLGLFDSGLGGLTVVKQVHALLPAHDLVYLADQANVPYGDRTAGDILRLVRAHLAWLDDQGCDAIVMACNTSCAVADIHGYPVTRGPVLDLIESAAISVRDAGYERIGVVATAATVKSRAYTRKIRTLLPDARVSEVAAPELVPLVEAGRIEGEEPRAAVAAVCAELPRDVEAVILACTHYPVLDAHFARALGTVARIDPAIEQAGRTAAVVAARGIAPGSGTVRCVTTGSEQAAFDANVARMLG